MNNRAHTYFILSVLFLLSVFNISDLAASSYITGYEQDSTRFTFSSDTGSVGYGCYSASSCPLGSWLIMSSPVVGYADAATQMLRAYARTADSTGTLRVSNIYADYAQTLYVGAGTSGLNEGDPVTLRLAIAMDGSIVTGNQPIPICSPTPILACGSSGASAISKIASLDFNGRYTIKDPNRLVCGEGCVPEEVVSFGAGGRQTLDAMNWGYVDRNYSYNYPWWIEKYDPTHDGTEEWAVDMSWGLRSNTGIFLEGSDESASLPVAETEFICASKSYHFDTGLQTIDFQTYVGAQLKINSNINIFPQAYGEGDFVVAMGDFMRSFGSGITSPYVSGIELTYATLPQSVSDLVIGKSHSGDFIAGTMGVYDLVVTNTGNSPTTGTITVTDNLPAGMTFVSANSSAGCTATGQTVVCTTAVVLQPGEQYNSTVAVNVDSSTVPSSGDAVINTATVSTPGEGNTTNNSASDRTVVIFPLEDTTPDQFAITDQTSVPLNSAIESNPIVVSGINAPSPISITGGTYSINCEAYSGTAATVNNGDTVTVRVISSGSYQAAASATLMIGGVSDTFSVTTIPDPPPETSASPDGGFYRTPMKVALSTNEPATVYYTTNGSNPTTGSTKYSIPIPIKSNTTLKFFGVDAAGSVGEVKTETYAFDTVRPVNGTLTIDPGAVNTTFDLSWAGFSDALSGVASYKLVTGTEGYPACRAAAIYSGTETTFSHAGLTLGKTYFYRVCATDNAGNISTGAKAFRKVLLEYDPPAGGSVLISGGAPYTKTARVSLTLNATDANTPLKMCVSNSATCTNWITYATAMTWTLPRNSGEKTVNVWFRDKDGNTNTAPASDTIILDRTKPVDGTLEIAPGAVNTTFDLSWNGFGDALSGVANYKLVAGTLEYPASSAKVLYSGTETTFSHAGLTLGKTYYYRVCATDNAGNLSTGAKAFRKVLP